MNTFHCHICQVEQADGVRSYVIGKGVTSDCRIWHEEAEMVVCAKCHAIQARINDSWRRQTEAIYKNYNTYAAAGGNEQNVMDMAGEAVAARSRILVDWLSDVGEGGKSGDLLDVGCGRGAFLKAYGEAYAGWKLHGSEFDVRNLSVLKEIPNFQGLHVGAFEDISAKFDLISMVHVLEHMEDPIGCLRTLWSKGHDDALLLIQVPDWVSNPFALTIADHATHFTAAQLDWVARSAGWEPLFPVANIISKELTLLAKKTSKTVRKGYPEDSVAMLESRVSWLSKVREQASEICNNSGVFGIFGTAIAGTWLAEGILEKLSYFVDEDSHRIGNKHLGVQIISPMDAGSNVDIFVGVAPVLSARLVEKYKNLPARFHEIIPF